MSRPRTRLALLGLGLAVIAACAAPALPSLEDRLVDPRLSRAPMPEGAAALSAALGLETRYHVSVSGLRLAYSILEPGEYGFDAGVQRDVETRVRFRAGPRQLAQAPAGTALLLHGWGMDRRSLYPWALTLAEAGHRVVLVDLRGHGESGDAPPGYGRREAEDLVELLAALEAGSDLVGPLHLFGVSYGGATAAHLAAALPERFASLTLLEPFANAADAVRDMVPALLESPDPRPWQRATRALLRLRFSPERVEAAIATSSARLGIDLDEVELTPLLASTSACTLLIHGGRDRHVGVQHGRRLAAGVTALQYRELPQEDHITLPLRIDWLGAPVAYWMRAVAASPAQACPRLQLAADPLPSAVPPRPGRLDLIEFALLAESAAPG